MKLKKTVSFLVGIITLGGMGVDTFCYAGVVNEFYSLVIFCFSILFISIILKKYNPRFLILIVLIQLFLTVLILPKYSYNDAKENVLKIYNQENVLNSKPKTRMTSLKFYDVIQFGYVYEIEYLGERIEVIVNPNNLDEYGIIGGKN